MRYSIKTTELSVKIISFVILPGLVAVTRLQYAPKNSCWISVYETNVHQSTYPVQLAIATKRIAHRVSHTATPEFIISLRLVQDVKESPSQIIHDTLVRKRAGNPIERRHIAHLLRWFALRAIPCILFFDLLQRLFQISD